jgi:DeoR/GlpR family transcriptional regulator of sugar metabolism
VGPLASATIDQFRGYRAFISADGLSMEFGITAGDIDIAYLYRQVIHNARETILLVDHSKFLIPSLFKITEFEAISRVVTDQRPPQEWLNFLGAKGVDLMYPEEAAGNPALEVG